MSEAKKKIPVWIDCDPGNDDAVAMLVAAYNENFHVVGISTVHGNTTIENTTYNALALSTLLHTTIPVYEGYGTPIKAKPKTAHHIHGSKGIGGFELLPEPTVKISGQKEEMFTKLAEALIEYKSELSIVAVGPLTNMGLFFTKYPELCDNVKYISIMGGAISERTWKIGEFNVTTDPEGAKLVLENPRLRHKTILIASDLTHKAIATKKTRDEMISIESPLRKLFYEIIMCFTENYKIQKRFFDGPPVHDPLALLALLSFYDIENKLEFQFKRRLLTVVTEEHDYGRVYLDIEDLDDGLYVGIDLNVDELWKVILRSLKDADDFVKEIG